MPTYFILLNPQSTRFLSIKNMLNDLISTSFISTAPSNVDYNSRKIIKLIDLMPHWWGWIRYDNAPKGN